ncbi:hypothetical protein [Hungatella effluvii]|nr:hypothetical protein [Hungatella effluvii]
MQMAGMIFQTRSGIDSLKSG